MERCFRFIVKEEENCLSDFFYMKFPKRQNYGDLKHQWFGGKGSEECLGRVQRVFRAEKRHGMTFS